MKSFVNAIKMEMKPSILEITSLETYLYQYVINTTKCGCFPLLI